MARYVRGLRIYDGDEGDLFVRGPTQDVGELTEGGDLIPISIAELAALLAGPGSFSLLYLTGIDGATGDLVIITDGGTGNPVTALTPV